MLRNPFYIGLFRWNEEHYEGTHPPIVSRELWDKVQQRLANRKKPQRGWVNNFPFTGLLHCASCGCFITAEHQKGHTYYHCTRKRRGFTCKEAYVREETLAFQLRRVLGEIMLPVEAITPILNQIQIWKKKALLNFEKGLPQFENRLKQIDLRIKRLLDNLLGYTIDREEYLTEKNRLLDTKLEIKEQMARLQTDGEAWIQPMSKFFEKAFQVPNLIQEDNLHAIREFFRETESELTLSLRVAHCKWKDPWKVLAGCNKGLHLLPVLLRETRAYFERKIMEKEMVEHE